MAKHARPAPEAEGKQQPAGPLEETAQMDRADLHFLLNFIALRHPEAYADARSAQAELTARNAAHRAQQVASVTRALDDGSGIWASYAGAIQEADDRAAREAGDEQP